LKRGVPHACLLALLVSTASLAACSLVTTWDGLGPPVLGDASTTSTDASPDVNVRTDAAPDVSTPVLCTAGAYYCGGHVLAGDAGALYKCGSNGTGTLAIACARSCTRHTTGNDACDCIAGSDYCGNDQIVGDPNTLYHCNGDMPATVVKACPGACLVRPGDDDICQ
jgi:hypothetical protein